MNTTEQNTTIHTDTRKSTVIKSLIWKFLERGGTQGVQFVIQIVLARLLSPDDYGTLAILLAFTALAQVFVQSGFNTALIQKKDSDELDFSSVFWLSIFVAVIFYLILFFTAPLIGKFYSKEELVPVIRGLSVILFFGALNSVQSAMVSKTMRFKSFFFSSTGAAIGSGVVGIVLAYKGFGIWALVGQQISNYLLISLILWFTVNWRPLFKFSLTRIKSLFSFGWKLLCSALLDTGYRQIYNLVVGKAYSSIDLGYFNRGEQFPSMIATNIDGSIQSVMLPAISANNDEKEKVKSMTRRSISMSCFVLMPCMIGMAAIAKPLVQLLLTDKWLPCVPFLQLACFSFMIYPIHTANLTAINAVGRSDIFLKLEIIKKIIGVVVMVVSIPFGIMCMAVTRIIAGILSSFVNAYPNQKLLNYSYFEQIKDILPSLILSLLMGVVIYALSFVPLHPGLLLLVQIPTGILLYWALSKLFKLEVYEYFVNTVKEMIHKRK